MARVYRERRIAPDSSGPSRCIECDTITSCDTPRRCAGRVRHKRLCPVEEPNGLCLTCNDDYSICEETSLLHFASIARRVIATAVLVN